MTLRPSAADLAVVSLGAAAGATIRWGLGELAPTESGFPWTIFAINITGAFLLGMVPLIHRGHHRATLLLGPGLLGGFTTVSTYADQVRGLAADGHMALAGTYLAGTLAAALAAAAAGHALAARPEPEDALT